MKQILLIFTCICMLSLSVIAQQTFQSGDTIFIGTPVIKGATIKLSSDQRLQVIDDNHLRITDTVTTSASFPLSLLFVDKQERVQVLDVITDPGGLDSLKINPRYDHIKYVISWWGIVILIGVVSLTFLLKRDLVVFYEKGRRICFLEWIGISMLFIVCIGMAYTVRKNMPSADSFNVGIWWTMINIVITHIKYRRKDVVIPPSMA